MKILVLILCGVAFAQGPIPVKCPYGAIDCYSGSGGVLVQECYKSLLIRKPNGETTCDTSVDLSKTNMIVNSAIKGQCDPFYTLVTFMNGRELLNWFCTPTPDPSAFASVAIMNGSQYSFFVKGCKNGYPDQKQTKCITRKSIGYFGETEGLAQAIDPIGVNCDVGFMDDSSVYCKICKEGYVVDRSEGRSECVKTSSIKNLPVGCLRAAHDKCTACNHYTGYLPTDDDVTGCYKFQ